MHEVKNHPVHNPFLDCNVNDTFQTMNDKNAKPTFNLNSPKFYIALTLLVAMLFGIDPWAIGVPIHEWVSAIVIIPIALIHIQIDWKWIVTMSQNIFKMKPQQTVFNYFWDWLLFIMFSAVIVSGFMISEALLPAWGFKIQKDPFWAALHEGSSNSLLIMLGVHVGMHWQWIKDTFYSFTTRKPSFSILKQMPKQIGYLLQKKNTLLNILIILFVGSVLSYVIYLLGKTSLADFIRLNFIEEEKQGLDLDAIPFVFKVILSVLLSLAKIGISALGTLSILRYQKQRKS